MGGSGRWQAHTSFHTCTHTKLDYTCTEACDKDAGDDDVQQAQVTRTIHAQQQQ